MFRNSTVTLNGSLSHSANGGSLSFAWTVKAPDASPVPVQNGNSASATFTASALGDYQVSLSVRDACGTTAQAAVTIHSTNGAPVANAGSDHWVVTGIPSPLVGSASFDPDGDALTYTWTLVSAPEGAGSFVIDPVEDPEFIAPVDGTYVFTLIVSDGLIQSPPATVTVNAEPAPIANAGPDQDVEQGHLVTLDGSGSYSPRGAPVTLLWTLVAPAGSRATLSDRTAVSPTFVTDVDGNYDVSLEVSDGRVWGFDTVQVVAERTIHRIGVTVVDAEYSASQDRIVLVALNPDRLYEVNPYDGSTESLDLNESPIAVSVSPDGTKAIVGQADQLTYVDLVTLSQIGSPLPISCDVSDVVLADQYAYVFPDSGQWMSIDVVRLSDGTETPSSGNNIYGGMKARLHPSGTRMYGTDTRLSPASLYRIDLSADGAATVSPNSTFGAGCGGLWFTSDGYDILTVCGDVRIASDNPNYDGTRLAIFQDDSANPPPALAGASDSVVAGEVAAIPRTGYLTDTMLERYDRSNFVIQSTTRLPRFIIDGNAYPSHGRFVFHTADGKHVVVLVKADDSAGGLANHGVVVY